MARMIRKQVYVSPQHERTLKRLARQRGLPEAELIREGIDRVASSPGSAVRDTSWWEREQRFIRKRLAMDVPQTGRGWTREDIYEERLGRHSR